MQQIYRKTPMSKYYFKCLCNFIEIALRHGYSLVNLQHIFGTVFLGKHLWSTASVIWYEPEQGYRKLRLIFSDNFLILLFWHRSLQKSTCVFHASDTCFRLCTVKSKPTNTHAITCNFEPRGSYKKNHSLQNYWSWFFGKKIA